MKKVIILSDESDLMFDMYYLENPYSHFEKLSFDLKIKVMSVSDNNFLTKLVIDGGYVKIFKEINVVINDLNPVDIYNISNIIFKEFSYEHKTVSDMFVKYILPNLELNYKLLTNFFTLYLNIPTEYLFFIETENSVEQNMLMIFIKQKIHTSDNNKIKIIEKNILGAFEVPFKPKYNTHFKSNLDYLFKGRYFVKSDYYRISFSLYSVYSEYLIYGVGNDFNKFFTDGIFTNNEFSSLLCFFQDYHINNRVYFDFIFSLENSEYTIKYKDIELTFKNKRCLVNLYDYLSKSGQENAIFYANNLKSLN